MGETLEKRVFLDCDIDGGLEENRKAAYLLMEAGIPYVSVGPSAEFPSFEKVILRYGPIIYHGIKEIKEFIQLWKDKKLPDFSFLGETSKK